MKRACSFIFKSLIMTVFLIAMSVITPATASAQNFQWCSSDGTYDFFLDADSFGGTRSGLTYVNVFRSDGLKIGFCFEHFRDVWKYNISEGPYRTNGFVPVSSSRFANDVLYLTLELRPW